MNTLKKSEHIHVTMPSSVGVNGPVRIPPCRMHCVHLWSRKGDARVLVRSWHVVYTLALLLVAVLPVLQGAG